VEAVANDRYAAGEKAAQDTCEQACEAAEEELTKALTGKEADELWA
jgi:hypothetical protein